MQKIVITNKLYFWIPYNILDKYFQLKGYQTPVALYDHDFISDGKYFYFKVNHLKYRSAGCVIEIRDLGEHPTSDELFDKFYFDENDEVLRTDKDFISVVESCKQDTLKVVEIPNYVEWYIDQNDGCSEIIREQSRSRY